MSYSYEEWEMERDARRFLRWIVAALFVLGTALLLVGGYGCQTTRNVTYIYVYDHSTATVRADGGSNAKPIEVAREATATVPLGGL